MAAPVRIQKVWLTAAGSIAVIAGLSLWCGRTPPIDVEAASARRAPLQVEVTTNGKVEPLPEAESRVHARLDGRIVAIPEPGARVAEGDVVLEIDAGPVAAELAAAESERLAALESLRVARDQYERSKRRAATDRELFQQGALTKQRWNEARASLDEARSRFENLEREVPLRVASLDLRIAELSAQTEAATVKAPFSGTVYRTEFKNGEQVRVGDPILWLADLTRLRVRANVDQVDLGRVRAGQKMRITSNAWPGRSWSAVVSEMVPHVVVKENRSVSEGLALVDPPTDGLVPGMTVDVDIVVEDVASALQVPAGAVHADDGRTFVYRISSGRAERIPVELGRASIDAVEIVGGLESDDRVIVRSSNGLHDGSRVKARVGDVAAR
ncbi:MAG: efflux RND transporter periplasmic adaptor subunit [Myxococcota bacterium]|nr:efflux RND transporter periplasmic adaptor subunit [Myxococcota bacterium]